MEPNPDHILIFKTNISEVNEYSGLHQALSSHPEITQWSVDTEDTDCVLRVVSEKLNVNHITEMIAQHGYDCSELE
jgi:hypothetical protein